MVKIKKYDIVIANLQEGEGCIQYGRRPCVVVQNDIGNLHSTTTIVCPITSAHDTRQPTHVKIKPCIDSKKAFGVILCEQITTVPKEDLVVVDRLKTNTIKSNIEKALKISLGL